MDCAKNRKATGIRPFPSTALPGKSQRKDDHLLAGFCSLPLTLLGIEDFETDCNSDPLKAELQQVGTAGQGFAIGIRELER